MDTLIRHQRRNTFLHKQWGDTLIPIMGVGYPHTPPEEEYLPTPAVGEYPHTHHGGGIPPYAIGGGIPSYNSSGGIPSYPSGGWDTTIRHQRADAVTCCSLAPFVLTEDTNEHAPIKLQQETPESAITQSRYVFRTLVRENADSGNEIDLSVDHN